MPDQKEKVHKIHPDDNVAVILLPVAEGESLVLQGEIIEVLDNITFGHKIALRHIRTGAKIVKYGLPIGSATCRIRPGEHVHTHNLKSDYLFQGES
jgi:hypothetical protein